MSDQFESYFSDITTKFEDYLAKEYAMEHTKLPVEKDEYELFVNQIKITNEYRRFKKKLNDFVEALENDNIMARIDYSCCSDCGTQNIYRDKGDKPYVGYVFYTKQISDVVYNQIYQGDTDITLTLNWCYFENSADDECTAGRTYNEYVSLAERISKIGVLCNVLVEGNDIRKPLFVTITVNDLALLDNLENELAPLSVSDNLLVSNNGTSLNDVVEKIVGEVLKNDEISKLSKRKRGRPKKTVIVEDDSPPKKRGRPRKIKKDEVISPKKRGRPKKTRE